MHDYTWPHGLLSNVLFNLWVFGNLLAIFLLLSSNLIPLWSENRHRMISSLLKLLRFHGVLFKCGRCVYTGLDPMLSAPGFWTLWHASLSGPLPSWLSIQSAPIQVPEGRQKLRKIRQQVPQQREAGLWWGKQCTSCQKTKSTTKAAWGLWV
jgi:hypothetical protein